MKEFAVPFVLGLFVVIGWDSDKDSPGSRARPAAAAVEKKCSRARQSGQQWARSPRPCKVKHSVCHKCRTPLA